MESIIFNELSKRAYKCACEHGFHNEELSNEHWLCLVVSKLMEAVEADRKGKRANTMQFEKGVSYPKNDFKDVYDFCTKGSVEEELADVAIRLLDLAGLRGITIDSFSEEDIYESTESCNGETFTESIYNIATIPVRFEYEYDYSFGKQLNSMLLGVIGLSNYMGIDLLWHIERKMEYNELRPKTHGCKY
jgi:NTP pyrophosphatase (non-canonical NTP hydrolase)